MIRRFVTVTTTAGTTSVIPVDSIIDIDSVVADDDGGELPRPSEMLRETPPTLVTRLRYITADGYAFRFVNHTPEQVLGFIAIAR